MEEVVVNAVFHKSYELSNPVEIQIFPDRISVLSFPGPLPPVDNKMLQQRRVISRDYRNRRIGEFLKELQLTEGRGTGFPLIHQALERNDSPKLQVETNEEQTYFLMTIQARKLPEQKPPLKPAQKTAQKTAQKGVLNEINAETKDQIITLLKAHPEYTKKDLMNILKKADGTVKEHLSKLKHKGVLKRVGGRKFGHWEVKETK